jgi:DNA repair photolyase
MMMSSQKKIGPFYQSRGPAAEYAGNIWSLNLYRGCSHRCGYCYVPRISRMERKDWNNLTPTPRVDLGQVERAAARLAKKHPDTMVFLSFTCDPYQPIEASAKITRSVLEILSANKLAVRILTKAGALPLRDMDILARDIRNEIGITLTTLRFAHAKTWEPGASYPDYRLHLLQAARDAGIQTWISFEPVLWPLDTLEAIYGAGHLAHKVYVGKLNHMSPPEPIDWPDFRCRAIDACEKLGLNYEIKKDLRDAR